MEALFKAKIVLTVWSSSQDSNPEALEYKTVMPANTPRRSLNTNDVLINTFL